MGDQGYSNNDLASGVSGSHYILNLGPYKTAEGMWDYLRHIYQQDNSAWRFHLEHELSQFNQGTISIQEYYSHFIRLWTDYTEIIYSNLPDALIAVVQSIHFTSQRDQFLMKLRSESKQVRSNLMSRVPTPSIDSCLGASSWGTTSYNPGCSSTSNFYRSTDCCLSCSSQTAK